MIEELNNLTLTARLCYVFMCIEKYLITIYPDKDWSPVAKRMWSWTNFYWDEGWDNYSVVVPEFILEFDSYEETNNRGFDGKLSIDDYLTFSKLYKEITDGKGTSEFDKMLIAPIDYANLCEGAADSWAMEQTTEILKEIISILNKNNIGLPNIDGINDMTLNTKRIGPDFVDKSYLSIILK